MPSPRIILVLLFVLCFGLSAKLEQWWITWEGNRADEDTLMGVVFGDGRKMFSNHFYVKADAYFHSGFYPSMFDAPLKESHDDEGEAPAVAMAQETGANKGKKQKELPGPGEPHDWLEAFGRNFFPSVHTHLDMGGAHDHDHDHAHDHGDEGHTPESSGQSIREILPWLRISAQMDPSRIETYTVTAYWLRTQLNEIDEAEAFLRDGLRANPQSYEIMFEMGRLFDGHRDDPDRARNIWELALLNWMKSEPAKEEPDRFALMQITSHLALLEEREGNLEASIRHMRLWQKASPENKVIQLRIDDLTARIQKAAEGKQL